MDRRESELTGEPPRKQEPEMTETRRKRLTRVTDLEKELESALAENEYLRCENAYLKKKMELEGRPVSLPDIRNGRSR
jgi:regulator of replication initiation timing